MCKNNDFLSTYYVYRNEYKKEGEYCLRHYINSQVAAAGAGNRHGLPGSLMILFKERTASKARKETILGMSIRRRVRLIITQHIQVL